MSENLKKFLETISKDDELINKAGKLGREAMIAFAKEVGFELSEEDFVQPKAVDRELSDDELDVVTGAGECYCAIGGGGTNKGGSPYANAHQGGLETCACVAAGFGYYKNGDPRCGCAFGGGGCD